MAGVLPAAVAEKKSLEKIVYYGYYMNIKEYSNINKEGQG
jgi:hypothetical protein